jgi:hypothetical protein
MFASMAKSGLFILSLGLIQTVINDPLLLILADGETHLSPH